MPATHSILVESLPLPRTNAEESFDLGKLTLVLNVPFLFTIGVPPLYVHTISRSRPEFIVVLTAFHIPRTDTIHPSTFDSPVMHPIGNDSLLNPTNVLSSNWPSPSTSLNTTSRNCLSAK